MNANLRSSALTPRSVEQRTEHFVVQYHGSGPAARNIRLLGARFEGLRAALVDLLALDEPDHAPIQVHLHDTENEDREGGLAGLRADGDIHVVYRADTPAARVDREILTRLLDLLVDGRAAEAGPLVDGLLGYATQLLGKHDPERVDAAVAAHLEEGRDITLAALLGDGGAADARLLGAARVSFVAYLLRAFGPDGLLRALKEFDPARPAAGVGVAVGRPPAAVERDWLGEIRRHHANLRGANGYLRSLRAYLRLDPWRAALILLLTVPAFAFEVFHPVVYALIIDEGILHHEPAMLVRFSLLLVGLILTQALGSVAREYTIGAFSGTVMTAVRARAFEHLQRLSLDFYTRTPELSDSVLEDLDGVEEALAGTFPQLASRFYTLVAWTILLFYFDWRIALLSVIVVPIAALGPRLFGTRAELAHEQYREHAGHAAGRVRETVVAQPVIKAFGLHQQHIRRFRGQLTTLAGSSRRARLSEALLETSTELGGMTYFVLAIALGAFLAEQGETTVGSLVAALDLLVYIVPNLRSLLSTTLPPMQEGARAMREVDHLLAEQPQVVDRPDVQTLQAAPASLELEDVTFSYTGEQVALESVSLSIHTGQFVALVGGSGSGKSTLLHLLPRFYDPTLGTIRLDDHDLRAVAQEAVRAQIGIVFQETILFDASIRENIRIGRLEADDAEVEAAARAAELAEFVGSLPQGYDTLVGEHGLRLSIGQRQRIAIARALLRNPAILLLDEATSALDAETEAAVLSTLRRIARGRTVVAASHRMPVAAQADHIVVLDHGRVVEQGTHAELLAREGAYFRLWRQSQSPLGVPAHAEAPTVAERLRTIPMFRQVDEAAMTGLAARVATEHFARGEELFHEGSLSDKVYIILSGQVEVLVTGPTGAQTVTAILGEGDHLGEMALRRSEPRTSSARARTAATLLTLERNQILKSVADVINLPDEQRALMTWLLRRGEVGPAEIAAHLGLAPEAAQGMVDALVASGYVQETAAADGPRYRARLAQRRGRELPKRIWQALGDSPAT